MNLISGSSSRIRFMASTPSSSGIRRSMRTTSGRSSRVFSRASRPFLASPTTVKSFSRPSIMDKPSRTTVWSSTINSLIASMNTYLSPELIPCLSRWDLNLYNCTPALAAVDGEASPKLTGSLFHAH